MTEDKQKSEFQDINRNFQRVDEASIGSEEEWMGLMRSGGYIKLLSTIETIDVYFRQFRPLCTKEEKKKMDELYWSLKDRAESEIGRINQAQTYSVMISPNRELLRDIREYLCEVYELRHAHNLLIRTIKRPNIHKRIENAVRF